jgi:hypothetical protein
LHAIDLRACVVLLDRVAAKLSAGAKVATVGRLGPGTVLIAHAYPRSHFLGFSADPEDVARAQHLASASGAGDRLAFDVGWPADFHGTGYDLVAHVEFLDGMPDVGSVARHVRRALAPDGTWMIVAPDALEAWLRRAVLAGGFTRFRRVGEAASRGAGPVCTRSPLLVVFEARA